MLGLTSTTMLVSSSMASRILSTGMVKSSSYGTSTVFMPLRFPNTPYMLNVGFTTTRFFPGCPKTCTRYPIPIRLPSVRVTFSGPTPTISAYLWTRGPSSGYIESVAGVIRDMTSSKSHLGRPSGFSFWSNLMKPSLPSGWFLRNVSFTYGSTYNMVAPGHQRLSSPLSERRTFRD